MLSRAPRSFSDAFFRDASELPIRAAFGRFLAAVALLVVLRVGAGLLSLPRATVPFADAILAVLFVAVPVLAIAQAARAPWRPLHAVGLIVGGVAVQGLAILLASRVGGFASLVFAALNGGALQVWCVGLGALLATLIRERNILIPITVFLAVFDLFLVLTPIGFTQRAMRAAPQVLASVGHAVPTVRSTDALPEDRDLAKPQVAGYIGPADLVFLGTYLIALARFGMRLKATVAAMVPTLALYLLFVLATGIALPALLPIGAVTLWVNRREFRLTRDEWLSTAVVVALGLALLAYGATRPKPKPEPEPPAAPSSPPRAPGPSTSPPSPARALADPPR